MTRGRLVLRGLRFYWRSHASVTAGVLLASAMLTGALLVGDSVEESLRAIALARLGEAHYALHTPNRFVAEGLADAVREETRAEVAAVLQLSGMALVQDPASGAASQVNRVQVVGVDGHFGRLAPDIPRQLADGEVALSAKLAAALGVHSGDDIGLRIERPSLMARDAPLAAGQGAPVTRTRCTVAAVLPASGIGRYSLLANQVAPHNAFVPLRWLQNQADVGGVNVILVGAGPSETSLSEALRTVWEPEHLGLRWREHASGVVQLESDRVFLDEEVADAALAMPQTTGTLTYLVNSIARGERLTPYSFAVAGVGAPGADGDEAVINAWLAAQLEAETGDSIEVAYYELLPSNEFIERERTFAVHRVAPMEALVAERELMPVFPGLSDVNRCRDWDVGIPMDEDRLADEANEAYWQQYRQTPKLFVSLEAGQAMWANRFGRYTAVRFAGGAGSVPEIRRHLKETIDPQKLGLQFAPVRVQALRAAAGAMDFGGLFLGMSFFLIAAALMLTVLLFVFGVQQRAGETGALLALGYRPDQVQRLVLAEAGVLSLVGAALGALVGTGYARALIHALGRFWQGALAHTAIDYHGEPATLFTGAAAGLIGALLAMAVASRRQVRQPVSELLAGDYSLEKGPTQPRRFGVRVGLALSLGGIAMASGLAVWVGLSGADDIAPTFFGVGALLLMSGLGLWRWALIALAYRSSAERHTLTRLAVQNMARRPGRSTAVAGLLACGTFLVLAVSSMQEDLTSRADQRGSGTGGFELLAQTTVPLRVAPEELLRESGATAVPVRVRDGDDAGCLNLNFTRSPRLLGVDPQAMSRLGAFLPAGEAEDLWQLLELDLPAGAVPALVGDSDTAMWGLQAATDPEHGDVLVYVDEQGDEVHVKLVGRLPMRLSLFQGTVVIGDGPFTRLFPSESGFRLFLIDAAEGRALETARDLRRMYQRQGMDVVSAVTRLQEYYAVESTYLAMFLVLGGLGLTLGSAGMAAVVLRNLLERRSEMAMLEALGFLPDAIRRVLLIEHGLLLLAGIAIGGVAAAAAMAPAIAATGSYVSLPLQAAMLALVIVTGAACTVAATTLGRQRDTLVVLGSD